MEFRPLTSHVQYLYHSPGDSGGINWDNASATDSFVTWVMYMPPSVQNQPTTWIPLARYTWKWNGTATKGTGWSLTSSPTSGQGSNNDLNLDFFEHPGWTKVSPLGIFLIGVP